MRTAWSVDGPPDGPPLVLLPSIGADRSMWAPQVDALAEDHLLVRVETRGHGAAPSTPAPYAIADLAGDVLDAADALGLDRVHIAGVSLGGLTALWLAVHAADRLRSLVVANTAARIGTAEGWRERADAVRRSGTEGIADLAMERFFSSGFRERSPATVAAARAVLCAVDDEGYVGCCDALGAADLRQDVGEIVTPAVVVGGTADVSTPPAAQESLAAAIPDSRLVILEGVGHLSNLEAPERFSNVLREHVAAHDRA